MVRLFRRLLLQSEHKLLEMNTQRQVFDFEEAWVKLGNLAETDKDWAIREAKEILRKRSLDIDQKVSLYFFLGKSYHELQYYKEAIAYYKKSLEFSSDDGDKVDSLILIGSAYFDLRKYRRA